MDSEKRIYQIAEFIGENIAYIKCSNEMIEECRSEGQITGFKFGCSLDDKISKTICILENDIKIALLDYTLCDKDMSINEFEVLNSKREQHYGNNIISLMQKRDEIDSMCLYPENMEAKEFWSKCGFKECDDGTGTMMMEWKK